MYKKLVSGTTLIETIVFLTVISLAIGALVRVYSQAMLNNVDPLIRLRALELTQSQLDEILARRFDENTPNGGVPACDSSDGVACLGISTPDADFDDVGDYDGFVDSSHPNHTVSVSVVNAGAEIGLPDEQARRITVSTTVSGSDNVVLSVYKTNF